MYTHCMIPENANESLRPSANQWLAGENGTGRGYRGREETFENDGDFHYLDYDGGFMHILLYAYTLCAVY